MYIGINISTDAINRKNRQGTMDGEANYVPIKIGKQRLADSIARLRCLLSHTAVSLQPDHVSTSASSPSFRKRKEQSVSGALSEAAPGKWVDKNVGDCVAAGILSSRWVCIFFALSFRTINSMA